MAEESKTFNRYPPMKSANEIENNCKLQLKQL